jgi:hypothetical protein
MKDSGIQFARNEPRTAGLRGILFAAALLGGGAANAQVLYDNGAHIFGTAGVSMTDHLPANNFTLEADAVIGSIRFWTVELPGAVWDGSAQWFLFFDDGGKPGGIIAEGQGSPTKTFVQTEGSWNLYQYDFDIADFGATGGEVYWLGLHVNQFFNNTEVIAWADGPNFDWNAPGGWTCLNGNFEWEYTGHEGAFQIYGTAPEPGSLLALGAMSLSLLRKRRWAPRA